MCLFRSLLPKNSTQKWGEKIQIAFSGPHLRFQVLLKFSSEKTVYLGVARWSPFLKSIRVFSAVGLAVNSD